MNTRTAAPSMGTFPVVNDQSRAMIRQSRRNMTGTTLAFPRSTNRISARSRGCRKHSVATENPHRPLRHLTNISLSLGPSSARTCSAKEKVEERRLLANKGNNSCKSYGILRSRGCWRSFNSVDTGDSYKASIQIISRLSA